MPVESAICEYNYVSHAWSMTWTSQTRYCKNGCCGTKYSDYEDVCCPQLSVSGIIGISVLVGLFALGALIAFIIWCVQHKNRSRVVVNPNNVAHTFVVHGTNQYYPQQLYGAYPAAGPSFIPQNQGHPPPYSEKQ
ncbi:hypothetical protein ACJMK2_015878, partial [Sinanodonta woodiana]